MDGLYNEAYSPSRSLSDIDSQTPLSNVIQSYISRSTYS